MEPVVPAIPVCYGAGKKGVLWTSSFLEVEGCLPFQIGMVRKDDESDPNTQCKRTHDEWPKEKWLESLPSIGQWPTHSHWVADVITGSGQSAQSHNTWYRKAKRGANMTKKTIRKSVFLTFYHAERREVSKYVVRELWMTFDCQSVVVGKEVLQFQSIRASWTGMLLAIQQKHESESLSLSSKASSVP